MWEKAKTQTENKQKQKKITTFEKASEIGVSKDLKLLLAILRNWR